MSKYLTLGWSLLALVLVGAIPTRAEERSVDRELKADVAAAEAVRLSVAVVEFEGAFTEQNVQARITSVLNELIRQKLDWSFEAFPPKPVVILYGDPTGKQQVRMAIGMSVPPKMEVKAPLKLEKVEFRKAVRHVHMGPHKELGSVYNQIAETLRKDRKGSASWPVVLQILDDPTRVKADQVRTLMNVPVK